MPERTRRSRLARLFAPLALLLCTGALVAVISSSNVIGDADDGGERTSEQTTATSAKQQEPRRRTNRARYTVKSGDTLGAIAERTGVPIERIQQLNPDLDPQALVAGQRIKLRP
jgi:LysM repeat protein